MHGEKRGVHREGWAGRWEERAALLYACRPSRSLHGAMPDELAGERSVFVEHRSSACTASLGLRRASRRRGRRARGGASDALGARSPSLRLSRGAREIRTASLRTGSVTLATGSDGQPLRSRARRERRGAFRNGYRFTTRGQRCAVRTAGCPPRRSACAARSARCAARSSACCTCSLRCAACSSACCTCSLRCAAHSERCSTHSLRRDARAKTPFTKSHAVITHFMGCASWC
jgi:hypothetical protein